MAAPSATVWGSAVQGSKTGRQGKIGIYTNVSSTATETTVNVQVWFWTIYTCADGSNSFYFNIGQNVTSATTKIGSVDINHTVNSGAGWSTTNQTKLYDKTYTYARSTSAVTHKIHAKFGGIDMLPDKTMYVNTSFTVPALATYTVTYNANGGTGGPPVATKWHGIGLTIPDYGPTRTGYTFKGWDLTKEGADSGHVYYAPGTTCGRNENLTLYAAWEAHTYSVSYDANGGTGAPADQTKTHAVSLTISSVVPTRTNYTFLGWALSKADADMGRWYYAPDSTCGRNENLILYAVWELAYTKPRISNFNVFRCNDTTADLDESGTAIGISFDWATDNPIRTAILSWSPSQEDGFDDNELTGDSRLSGNSGHYVEVCLEYGFNLDTTYKFQLTISDGDGEQYHSVAFVTLSGANYAIDFKPPSEDSTGGAALNKPAEMSGVFDVNLETYLRGGLRYGVLENGANLDGIFTTGFYVGSHLYSYVNCPLSTGNSFTLEVMSGGDIGQLTQRLTQCNMDHPVTYERAYHESYWGEWILISPFAIWQAIPHTPAAANTLELVGSITIPKFKVFTITARGLWNNAQCGGVVISTSNTEYRHTLASQFNDNQAVFYPSCTFSGNTGSEPWTLYFWGKWAATNANSIEVSGFYMPH